MKYKKWDRELLPIMDWTCNHCGQDDYVSCFDYRICEKCGKRSLGNPYGIVNNHIYHLKGEEDWDEITKNITKIIEEDDT